MLTLLSVVAAALAEAMRTNSNYYYSMELLQALLLLLLTWSSKVQCNINVVLSAAEYYRLTG